MRISQIMRRWPLTIAETDTLGTAQLTMRRGHVRHLPVIAGGRAVGMLSERDVLAARARAADEDQDWWSIRVHAAMTPPQTAHPDDSLTEVAARLAASRLGAMPIVERGSLLGIVTVSDVLDAEVRLAMGSPATQATAADVMTPLPVIVRPDTGIAEAVSLMVRHHVRHLPVVDPTSTLVGVLSERDVRSAIGDPTTYLASEDATATLHVADVMSTPPVVVGPATPLSELARRFADDRIGAVPVVDQFGALIGIVSYVDALHALTDQ